MQLDQPIPPTGNGGGQNPYDFILSDAPKPRRSLLPTGKSKTQRIIFFLVGVVLVFILFAVVLSLISNAGKASTKALVEIAQSQTEINRVADTSSAKIRDGAVLNYDQNVLLTMASDQQQSVAYLASHGQKVKQKNLALGHSAATDSALQSAEQDGSYDSTVLTVLQKQLTAYQKQLADAYKNTKSKSQKALLSEFYLHATDLQKNAPSSPSQ